MATFRENGAKYICNRYNLTYGFEREKSYTLFYFKLKRFNHRDVVTGIHKLVPTKVRLKASERHVMAIYKQVVESIPDWTESKGRSFSLPRILKMETEKYFKGLDIARKEIEKVIGCRIRIKKY